MQERCPFCEKNVPSGSIVCPNCGSQLIHVEEKKRVWHLYAAPAVLFLVLVAAILYLQYRLRAEEEARANAPVVRVVDKARAKQIDDDEARRARVLEKRKGIQDVRHKRAEEAAQFEQWKALPNDQKLAYLQDGLKKAKTRLAAVEGQVKGEAWAAELRDWVQRANATAQAAQALVDAGRLEQAKGMVDGLLKELSDVFPEGEETAPAGTPPPPAPSASAAP